MLPDLIHEHANIHSVAIVKTLMRGLPRALVILLPVLSSCGGETMLEPAADGWIAASPSSQGMDQSVLEEADELAETFLTMRSFIVVRHGFIVFERYYRGFGPDDRPALRSVTKSIASVAYGVALERGDLPGLDRPVEETFPEYFGPDDEAKRRITVRHILTMTSGLNSSEADPDTLAVSWVKAYLQAPLISEPGAVFRYDGAIPHVLSGMLTASVEKSLAEYTQQHVFDPLGITGVTWESDPEGFTKGFSGIAIRARDMAKIGKLYVQDGMWEGQQLVPSEWVEASSQNQAPGGSASAGYSYLWWISGETGYRGFYGAGYGGQYIYVIPALDVVVVITGDPDVTPEAPIYHGNLVPLFIPRAIRGP